MSVHVDPDVNLGMSNRGDHKPADEENSKKLADRRLADRRLAEYAVKLAEDMYQALNGPYTTYKTARPFFEQRLRSLKDELSPTSWDQKDSPIHTGLTAICCNGTEVAWVAPHVGSGYAWFARSDGKARYDALGHPLSGHKDVEETKARAMQAAINWYKEKTWGRPGVARSPG